MAITIQTSYGEDRPAAYPGMIADGGTTKRLGATVAPAGPGLPFGVAGFSVDISQNWVAPVPATGKFLGIAIADAGIIETRPWMIERADGYPPLASVSLLTKGKIWVIAGADVTEGQPAYVSPSDTSRFTNVASGNVPIPAQFDETRLQGSLVPIRVLA